MKELIAIIEDEPDILELVSIHLKKANFIVREFPDARNFYRFLEKDKPDLIVLDLMLPDEDGLEICKYLRKKDEYSTIPIIILSAKGEETDKVLGLELGADDYISKPFSTKELVARVKAVLRRSSKKEEVTHIKISNILEIDENKFEVYVQGKKVALTSTEFKILKKLASKKGWVFSRDKLLDYLWGHDKIVIDRTIDVHIKHLRAKLGKAGRLIKNVRGVGYKLEE